MNGNVCEVPSTKNTVEVMIAPSEFRSGIWQYRYILSNASSLTCAEVLVRARCLDRDSADKEFSGIKVC